MLVMVVTFILWAIGLVDLLTHTNPDPANHVVGPYALSIVVLIAAYAMLLFVWLAVLLVPRSHLWIQRMIARVQSRTWQVISAYVGIGAVIWSLFRFSQWNDFPGLGLAVFCLMILLGLVLLISGWGKHTGQQPWRKFIAIPLVLCLLIEGVAQVAAYAGALPNMTINSGLYVPNGRIYQSEEGFANGTVNTDGWYYPEFELSDRKQNVILLGDTFLQAMQIAPEENLGVHLHEQIAEAELTISGKTQLAALGMPGFGPGLYLSETRLTHAVERFNPREIVLFFHLANDFQIVTEPSGYELFHEINADGKVDIHEEDWENRHNLQHLILHGYEPGILPLKTFSTNILAPKIVRQLLNRSDAPAQPTALDLPRMTGEVLSTRRVDSTHVDVTNFRLVSKPGASNFLFETAQTERAQNAHEIATGLLRQSNDLLKEQSVKLRIVTIPAFPPAFFDEPESSEWTAELGPYDLLLPERQLAEFAAAEGIDFLAMGQYMQASGLTNKQIHELYFNNGQGHFTPAGHRYFADSIFDCFYSQAPSESCQVQK